MARSHARRATRTLVSLVLLVGPAGCGASPSGTPASSPSAARTASPPDLPALRALLVPLHAHVFTAEEQERGCPDDQTLGEYLALLDSNTEPDPAEPDRVNERTGGCDVTTDDAMWPGPDAATWRCTVRAHSRDAAGESPWTYELRVRVRRADQTLDASWIACPGLP